MFGGFRHPKAVSEHLKQKEYYKKHFEIRYQEIFGKESMKEQNGHQQENKDI